MKIIDAHCHYGSGDGLNGPWDTRASIQKYLGWADEAGIGQTVLFAPFHSHYAEANRKVGEMVKKNPRRFFGFAFVNAEKDSGRVFSMIKHAVQLYGFKGIKVHRHDAHISREICEVAQAFRLPVLYDVMGKVESVELLATEFPKVNFIIPHLGSFADDWRVQLAFIPLLRRHKNVYTDTSGIRRFDLLEMAIQEGGAHKVLFGSDGPWLHPGVELEKVFALKLSLADEKKILHGNFLRLISKVRKRPMNLGNLTSLSRRKALQ